MKFVVERDKKKEWRWQLRARNGKIVADSGEGYKNLADCVGMAEKIKAQVSRAEIEVRKTKVKIIEAKVVKPKAKAKKKPKKK